jgi:hypothetical protein
VFVVLILHSTILPSEAQSSPQHPACPPRRCGHLHQHGWERNTARRQDIGAGRGEYRPRDGDYSPAGDMRRFFT